MYVQDRKKKHAISENRRCPNCKTKSHSKFLGDFMIYAYHCDKCGTVHTVFVSSSIELMPILQKGGDISNMTVADIVNILQSTPRVVTFADLLHTAELQVVLSTLAELERETGMAEKTTLLNKLEGKHMPRGEAERIIGFLLREGRIYECREGYFKKT
jgi:ribosomal protein S27AE